MERISKSSKRELIVWSDYQIYNCKSTCWLFKENTALKGMKSSVWNVGNTLITFWSKEMSGFIVRSLYEGWFSSFWKPPKSCSSLINTLFTNVHAEQPKPLRTATSCWCFRTALENLTTIWSCAYEFHKGPTGNKVQVFRCHGSPVLASLV